MLDRKCMKCKEMQGNVGKGNVGNVWKCKEVWKSMKCREMSGNVWKCKEM